MFIYLSVARFGGERSQIKLPCQQMKQDELAGEIFDSELEIASAVIYGVEVKGERGNYRTQSVKFNFNHGS
jgi:putative transposase